MNSNNTMSPNANTILESEFNKKSMVVAYLFLFFLGLLGGHRFYLKQKSIAISMLLITIFSSLKIFNLFAGYSFEGRIDSASLLIAFVGFIALTIIFIWCIVDAFLIPRIVQKYNTDMTINLSVNKKSKLLAYVLWWYFGLFGGHRFYLGRSKSAYNMILLWVAFIIVILVTPSKLDNNEVIVLTILGGFFLTIFGWWLIDAFFVPWMVKKYNQKLIDSAGQ